MNKNSYRNIIVLFILVGCLSMYFVEAVVSPSYFYKSVMKIILFGGLYLIFNKIASSMEFKNKISFKFSKSYLLLGILVYALILLAYIVAKNFYDFSAVLDSLNEINVNKENFIFVAVYISLVNSLLEETFFRKLGFLYLKEVSSTRVAAIFSALMFSAYHISIIEGWFSPVLFVLIIIALFICGLFFNYIDYRNNSSMPSWIIHISANLSINTIGLFLFMKV